MSARSTGDAGIAARLAAGGLADVPPEALAAGLRLPLHDFLGLQLVGLRPVVLELALGEPTRTPVGPLHGGVVATLADVAGNVAAATSGAVDVTRHGLVTGRLEVDFRAQPRGDRVRVEATVAEVARRAVTSACTVTDETGRRLASAVVVTRLVPRAGLPLSGLDGAGGC